MNEGISFQAIFSKATTTIDGGWRISFDVDQSEAQKISTLAELRDVMLQIAVIPVI